MERLTLQLFTINFISSLSLFRGFQLEVDSEYVHGHAQAH